MNEAQAQEIIELLKNLNALIEKQNEVLANIDTNIGYIESSTSDTALNTASK